MFSGIVEEVGVVTALTRPAADAARMAIGARTVLDGTQVGASIAVDGVCQTVVAIDGRTLTIDSVGATLRKTTLGSFAAGRRVNLERPLAFGNRVDGHLVQATSTTPARSPAGRSSARHAGWRSGCRGRCCRTSCWKARSPSTGSASRSPGSRTTAPASRSSPTPRARPP